MRKLISFSAFLMLVIIALIAKTSHAQVIKVRSGMVVTSRICTTGFWKWNPRFQRYVLDKQTNDPSAAHPICKGICYPVILFNIRQFLLTCPSEI